MLWLCFGNALCMLRKYILIAYTIFIYYFYYAYNGTHIYSVL